MNVRRTAGTLLGYALLAVSAAAALWGVAALVGAALGSGVGGVLAATVAAGVAFFAASAGYFVLMATRGRVLPIEQGRDAASTVFRSGQGGG